MYPSQKRDLFLLLSFWLLVNSFFIFFFSLSFFSFSFFHSFFFFLPIVAIPVATCVSVAEEGLFFASFILACSELFFSFSFFHFFFSFFHFLLFFGLFVYLSQKRECFVVFLFGL